MRWGSDLIQSSLSLMSDSIATVPVGRKEWAMKLWTESEQITSEIFGFGKLTFGLARNLRTCWRNSNEIILDLVWVYWIKTRVEGLDFPGGKCSPMQKGGWLSRCSSEFRRCDAVQALASLPPWRQWPLRFKLVSIFSVEFEMLSHSRGESQLLPLPKHRIVRITNFDCLPIAAPLQDYSFMHELFYVTREIWQNESRWWRGREHKHRNRHWHGAVKTAR